MVPTYPPSGNNTQHVAKIKNQPKTFDVCTGIRRIQLQQNIISTARNKGRHHEWANQRGTWADHGKEGWYTGPADQQYRHYQVYITTTGGSRLSDTIDFPPTKVTMPKRSSDDRTTAATKELTEAVKYPAPRTQ